MRSKFASIPSILRDTTAKFIDSSEKYKQECLKQVAYANEHNFFEEINELTSLAAERERMKLRRIEQMSARDMQLQEKELQRVLEDEEANLAFIYQCTDALRQNFQKKQEQQIFDIQLASLHRSASAASLTSASVPTVGEYPVRHTDFYESDVENTTRYSKPGRPVRFVPSNVDGQEQFIDVMNATSLTRTITEVSIIILNVYYSIQFLRFWSPLPIRRSLTMAITGTTARTRFQISSLGIKERRENNRHLIVDFDQLEKCSL